MMMMMMTISLLRMKKPRPLILTTCEPRTHASCGRPTQQMERSVSDVDERFVDHHVGRFTVACSLGLEHSLCATGRAGGGQRRRVAHFLRALAERTALPGELENSLCNSWTWRIVGQARLVCRVSIPNRWLWQPAFTSTSSCTPPWTTQKRTRCQWVESCRLRGALQGGLGPRSAVTDSGAWPIVWQQITSSLSCAALLHCRLGLGKAV